MSPRKHYVRAVCIGAVLGFTFAAALSGNGSPFVWGFVTLVYGSAFFADLARLKP